MRVIAGKYKSRQLKTVKSTLTRPTTDRNKENLFNIIGPYVHGGNVLDVFGGSGGLGIEALSRGCEYLYTNDNQYEAFKVIQENIKALQIENASVFKMDYRKLLQKLSLQKITFDLVLLDPPYGKYLIDDIIEYLLTNTMLQDQSILVVEELKEVEIKEFSQLECIKEVIYGITTLHVYKYNKE